MTGITHAFVNPKSDGGDATITRPSDWNAPHPNVGSVLLEQHPASSSATLDFTTFISADYDEYEFHFVGLKPATTT